MSGSSSITSTRVMAVTYSGGACRVGAMMGIVPLRSVALVSGMWLVTVAAASALTWSVISLAGAHVGQPGVVAIPTPVANASTAGSPRTWTGAAGKVTARCTDGDISLVAATPSDGFGVEVKDRGPTQLLLEFERKDAAAETRVRATCIDDSPAFTRD